MLSHGPRFRDKELTFSDSAEIVKHRCGALDCAILSHSQQQHKKSDMNGILEGVIGTLDFELRRESRTQLGR